MTVTKTRKALSRHDTGNQPVPHPTWAAGDATPQGDLLFVALQTMPKSAKARINRQLAEGDTKGSRHVAQGGVVHDADKAELRAMIHAATGCDVSANYIGPVFTGDVIVEHPEHAHQSFPAIPGCTAVVYQRNLDAEEREQRARD
jgi:hypothetical protein